MHEIADLTAVLTGIAGPARESVRRLAGAPRSVQFLAASTALGAVYFGVRSLNTTADKTSDGKKPAELVQNMLGLITSTCGFASSVLLAGSGKYR